MKTRRTNRTGVRRPLRVTALAALGALCLAAAAPSPAPTPAPKEAARGPMQDMSGILGKGSQLQAGKDGEFTIGLGDDGQLDRFKAVKDVILLTEDIDLNCDEMVYLRPDGIITAKAIQRGHVVRIDLRNINPGGEKTKKGKTWALCRHFKFFVNEKRYELTVNPILHQIDDEGKETAISGDKITMVQGKTGRWEMHVEGNPKIYDPKRKDALKRASEKTGVAKPTVQIDRQGTGPEPDSAAKTSPSPKAVKIDSGNVEDVRRPKPPRVIKLEEGG